MQLNISSLSLHHFRNYEAARLSVTPAPVVLFGHNGAGKTNLLEALSLLVPGRGLRRAKLGDLKQASCADPWAVVAYANGLQGEVMIATGRDMENTSDIEKRALKIDGKPAKSQADLTRHMSMLWLTPQMEQIFLESTSEARKFLDRLVYSFAAEHATHVNAYEQAMRERNRLLALGNADSSWLSALENTMAEKAAAIAAARLSTVQHINHAVQGSTLSFPKPQLAVRGLVEDALAEGKSALEAENHFRDALCGGRNRDAAAGRTLAGPHRSELLVTHRERGVLAHLCSTGEQKALILSIILAQSRAGSMWNGVVPVILLDEVVAHLDPARRLELFAEICDSKAQVWMTGTDRSLFSGIESAAQFFEVRNGTIV
ncbi:MAG: DNA replication/repair protein RecF [Alphaproteobacteria bacterium]|nr:DNA replication/repair protein RecF [Alphaproteobacteria bacterium]